MSCRNKDLLPGIDFTWSEVIQGAFEGASVVVGIATLDQPSAWEQQPDALQSRAPTT